MNIYAKKLNDKKGDELPVTMARQPKETGVAYYIKE